MKEDLNKYIDEWLKLYNSGMSLREIAKQYSVRYSSVSLRLRKVTKFRPKSKIQDKEIQDKIVDMYLKGIKIYQITKELKIGYQSTKKGIN